MLWVVGLGLMAGAVLQRPLSAQVDTTRRDTTVKVPVGPRADSILRDSLAKIAARDSARARAARDTIRAPLAHAEMPPVYGIARRYYWSRDSMFATGSLTLADLLARVPGLTLLRAGWIASPAVGAYMGDVRRVRVFFDGAELPALDPRAGGALDLTQISLWALEDVEVEQAADEVRVYLRSWRVRSTIANTRADIATGDQQTNLYRGFFGKRLNNGGSVQFGAQQYGTTPPSALGSSSDQTSVIGRLGWANARWSIDAFADRVGGHRGAITPLVGDSIPTTASTRTDAYLRLGHGDPDTSHAWAQVMAVASKYDYTGIRDLAVPLALDTLTALTQAPQWLKAHGDSLPLDTTTFTSQYIATGGASRGPFRLSGTGRLFVSGGHKVFTPSARASFTSGQLSVTAYLQGQGIDSISHQDVSAQFTPFSFLSIEGSTGRATDAHGAVYVTNYLVIDSTTQRPLPTHASDTSYTTSYMRGEAALRLKSLWFAAGLLHRGSMRLSAPTVFDTAFASVVAPAATAITAGIRGRLWGPLQTDLSAVRWMDTAGVYRPQYQTRSELFVTTNLLRRFPSGDFGLLASVVHEYRSGDHFPLTDGTLEPVPGYRTISTRLEIRILDGTVWWQFRNVLGAIYS